MQNETSPLRGAVVLVVEDKPDVLEATGYLLEAAFGCTALLASSCVEALAQIDEGRRIDLIFSDVILPGKDGLTLARLAQERSPNLPVALVTGWADEIDSITNRGFIALLKPYTVEQLQAVFTELLSSRILCVESPSGDDVMECLPSSTRSRTTEKDAWHANDK
jgi:CheY-like chemotaxis protein